MSLFWRSGSAVEERAVTSLPWSHDGNPGAGSSLEGNLSLVPVYAATRLIADAVSSLPLDQFRKTNDGRVPMPLSPVFSGRYGTQVDWLGRCMTSLLLRGNSVGLRSGIAGMGGTEWLHPDKVSYHEGRWFYNGAPLDEAEIVHIPGLVVPGSRLGLSPIAACAATMDTGHETQRFMKDWYRNKAVPGMVFRNSERTVDPTTAAETMERLRSTLRAGDPFVTGKDWTLDVIKLSADDAGFVASSRLTATQIANIFGITPEMIGGETGKSLTYSTLESNQLNLVTNTLRPWIVRLEAAFSALLPKPQFVKFNVDALLRADIATRYKVHQIARTIGLNNIDELRALEDEAPLPDGAGQDYTPLKAAPPALDPQENQ